MKIDTSRPAFPFKHDYNPDQPSISSEGMSMREYFAAHAPEVPEWYRILVPEKLGALELPKSFDYADQWSNEAIEWVKSLGPNAGYQERALSFCLPGNGPDSTINPYIIAASEVQKENERRGMALRAYKLRSWRYYYADMMLAEEDNSEITKELQETSKETKRIYRKDNDPTGEGV